jgi:hypothetical protein
MVLLQSYSDEFKLEKKCFNTPATPGTVLKSPAEDGKVLDGKDQTILRSGNGKLMYHMQYLWPDITQAVRNLVRHMTQGNETHMPAILRCMQYLTCTSQPESGMGLASFSSRLEEGRTMQRISRQGKVSLGMLYTWKKLL